MNRRHDKVAILRAQCKVCENSERKLRAERMREKRLAFEAYLKEQERLKKEAVKHLVAQPRTFVKPEVWDGKHEPMFIRNEGLKHIPSRGLI